MSVSAAFPASRPLERARTLNERLAPYAQQILLTPLGLFLLLFFFIPIVSLLRVSLRPGSGASGFGIGGGEVETDVSWTFDNYVRMFTDSYFLSIFGFTIAFAILVTAITMLISYPMAFYIYRAPPRLKTLLLMIVVLPKLSNMLVLVYGLQAIFANNGIINELLIQLGLASFEDPPKLVYTLFSATVSKVLLVAPYTILVITAALHTLDPSLREASLGLGASKSRTFWLVTFPLSLPGVLVALLITIVWSLGAFVSPLLLGNPETQTLAVEVQKQTFENVNEPMGATIAFVILAMMTLVVFLYNWLVNARLHWQEDGR